MHRLRSLFGLVVIGMLLSTSTNAEAAVKDDVRSVVESQLEAFRKNDFKTAYGFAHTGIKDQFAAPEFERMVRAGFPEMLKAGAVEFIEVRSDETTAGVKVMLTDEQGKRSGLQYLLQKDGGEWRIIGVVPIEIPPVLV